jgi:uridine phosphorylase
MFKIANTLILNHGMGFGSLSIALHEILKLLHYAKAKDLTFIRMGTCG